MQRNLISTCEEDLPMVLSGKKVNREAFKGLIDQLWSPFGSVEIELLGDNTFMFYFVNRVDRNRFWQKEPWHFGKSLIALEKLVGFEGIKNLSFNKAEFWVQIHDIPIMCMNQRTTKWLAEQIGGVIEIPMDSKECWGKHEINECLDEAVRKKVFDGSSTKFGSWLKAPLPKNSNSRYQLSWSGSSSYKDRFAGRSRELPRVGSSRLKPDSLVSQDGESANAVVAARKTTIGYQSKFQR
ncbi:hypothetical protein EZV62_014892 [Acer yangbiense]|uniref:DUF4283 domain-containing protein n=1 Tax=Acer yangbiense TaxID=1000413 RepID=A0A5C7HUA5_9ROSI|nr:hypothetical protein EZV62_014892 [Acer yangbiense]